jgi:hypothetical protein
MIRKNKAVLTLGGALLLVAGLPGCSGSRDDATVSENVVEENSAVETPPPVEPLPAQTPTPEPLPSIDLNATAEALPPETTPSQDEQMADDASATGMTARASRDEAAGEPATGGNFSDR